MLGIEVGLASCSYSTCLCIILFVKAVIWVWYDEITEAASGAVRAHMNAVEGMCFHSHTGFCHFSICMQYCLSESTPNLPSHKLKIHQDKAFQPITFARDVQRGLDQKVSWDKSICGLFLPHHHLDSVGSVIANGNYFCCWTTTCWGKGFFSLFFHFKHGCFRQHLELPPCCQNLRWSFLSFCGINSARILHVSFILPDCCIISF